MHITMSYFYIIIVQVHKSKAMYVQSQNLKEDSKAVTDEVCVWGGGGRGLMLCSKR